jgi:hypothetical protein
VRSSCTLVKQLTPADDPGIVTSPGFEYLTNAIFFISFWTPFPASTGGQLVLSLRIQPRQGCSWKECGWSRPCAERRSGDCFGWDVQQ